MNSKRLIILSSVLALLLFSADSVYSQRSRRSVKDATWQNTVDDSKRGNVILGLRDKWSALGNYTAAFLVTAPGKKKFRGQTKATKDDWAYVNFPKDFNGKPVARGVYTVIFYANGVIVGRSNFRFRP